MPGILPIMPGIPPGGPIMPGIMPGIPPIMPGIPIMPGGPIIPGGPDMPPGIPLACMLLIICCRKRTASCECADPKAAQRLWEAGWRGVGSVAPAC